MKILMGIVYFLLLSLALTFVFSRIFRIRGPWGSFWSFFLILFLAIWAADAWMTPIGPYWKDVYWVPPLIVGVLFAFLLAAATPNPKSRAIMEGKKDKRENIAIALGGFFWVLVVLLVGVVVSGIVANIAQT